MSSLRAVLKIMATRLGVFSVVRDLEMQLNARAGRVHDNEYRKIPSHVDGGLIVDVGANLGQSIVSLHRLFPASQIHAFEPNPQCLKTLRKISSTVGADIVLANVGLGSEDSVLDFHVPVLATGVELLQEGSFDERVFSEPVTQARIGREFSLKRIQVPIGRLDSYCLNPSLIKIDVQGFEVQVIEGAMDTIRRAHPVIFLERDARTEKYIGRILTDVGYRGRAFQSNLLFVHSNGQV